MRYKIDSTTKNTFGFKFENDNYVETVSMIYIGHEIKTDDNQYYWDLSQQQESNSYIFQYTLSGEGEIQLNNKIYPLKKGTAFIVPVPENCIYYVPKGSKWEFIFITLKGAEAKKCWERIRENELQIVEFDNHSPLILKLLDIYKKTISGAILDKFENSTQGYSFIMNLYHQMEHGNESKWIKTYDSEISNALLFIEQNYANPQLQLEDIANYVGLSQFYFIKKFKAAVSLTPSKYLLQYRMNEAIKLLHHTELTIKEISSRVGFSDPGYFNRVFRQKTGFAPGKFLRNKISHSDVKFIVTEGGLHQSTKL